MNRLAFALLAVTCVAAAGGGAYFATKQNQAALPVGPASVQTQPATPGTPATVTETESIVDEVSKVDAVKPAVTAPRAPRRPAPTRAAQRPAVAERSTASQSSRPEERGASATEAAANRSTSSAVPEPAPQVTAVQPSLAPLAVESRPPVPEKIFEDLTVAADSVLGLQVDTALTSERAKVEDKVNARVTRDVKVGSDIAIPAGSRVEGSVTLVDRGGKVKERARLGIRFHTLVLADGTRVSLSTEALYREGQSPTGESTAKIGGAAVGGAILGAIMGGGKGATIGGAVGAAGGTAAVMAGDRNAATLPAGSTVTVRILSPVTVTVEK
jgi:cell division protein FtsN